MALLLVVQFCLYTLAWLFAAGLLSDARRPALLWAVYCATQAGGLIYQMVADPGGSLLAAPAAMLLQLGYVAANVGLDSFLHGRARHLRLMLAMLALSEAWLLACVIWEAPPLARVLGYNGALVVLLLLPLATLRQSLVAEYGAMGWLALLPATAMGLMVLLRCVELLLNPGTLETLRPMLESPRLLLISLVAGCVFNLGLLGLVIGRLVRRLRGQVETDALTEVASRAALQRHLGTAWHAARRHRTPLSLAFVDVDRFKQINDRAGHDVGDRVLQHVAESLRRRARQTDVVGRWAGDEFVVLMPHTDAEGAGHAVRRLAHCLEPLALDLPPDCPPPALSIGVATLRPEDVDANALLVRADADMYRAKRERHTAEPVPG